MKPWFQYTRKDHFKSIISKYNSKIKNRVTIEECPICFESTEKGIMLTCNHAFCEVCINALIENNHVKCPLCRRKTVNGLDVKLTNDEINKIIDSFEKLHFGKENPQMKWILYKIAQFHNINITVRIMISRWREEAYEDWWRTASLSLNK